MEIDSTTSFLHELTPVTDAMNVLRQALYDDPEYAWSWHCNLAMASIDEGMDWNSAQFAAARFMQICFGVDTTKNDHFEAEDKPFLEKVAVNSDARLVHAKELLQKYDETCLKLGATHPMAYGQYHWVVQACFAAIRILPTPIIASPPTTK